MHLLEVCSHLPPLARVLSEKVRNFYNYTVARAVRNEEKDIISGLPMGLRMQVGLVLRTWGSRGVWAWEWRVRLTA